MCTSDDERGIVRRTPALWEGRTGGQSAGTARRGVTARVALPRAYRAGASSPWLSPDRAERVLFGSTGRWCAHDDDGIYWTNVATASLRAPPRRDRHRARSAERDYVAWAKRHRGNVSTGTGLRSTTGGHLRNSPCKRAHRKIRSIVRPDVCTRGTRDAHGRIRSAALPIAQRRSDLDARSLPKLEDRRRRPLHRSERKADHLRDALGGRPPTVGDRERRERQRDLPLPRRRRYLDRDHSRCGPAQRCPG